MSVGMNQSSVPGQVISRIGTLEVKTFLDEKTMSKLVMKVVNTIEGGDMWTDDDLRVMEQYFSEFVAPIQHQHANASFLRFLLYSRSVHGGAPRSLVALMRHQLKRDTTKPWSPSLCLILPPPHLVTPYLTAIGASSIVPGMMAIMVNREQHKMLLWIKLVSNIDPKQQWIFPLLYDGESNGLTVFTGAGGGAQQQSTIQTQYPIVGEVNSILRRHATPGSSFQTYISECSIWPSINGLAESLPHQQQQPGGAEGPKS